MSFTHGPITPIALEKKYHGLSVQLIGCIQHVRVPFSIDMGVGDIITPAAQEREVYALLPDEKAPCILTYSLESTIAEKLDAMIHLLELNSRMKDFYDIYDLSRRFPFEGGCLCEAIGATLDNRGTLCDASTGPRLRAMAADAGMQMKWDHFLRTIHTSELSFEQVMEQILAFLGPVLTARATNQTCTAAWHPETGWHA